MTGMPAEPKMRSKASRLSTSMLPVDEPMKSFMPGMRWASSRSKRATLAFVAPKKKEWLT